MSRKKIVPRLLTREERIQEELKRALSMFISGVRSPGYAGVPFPPDALKFKVGERDIQIGMLKNTEVVFVTEDYRFLVIEHDHFERDKDVSRHFWAGPWYDVRRTAQEKPTTFATKKEDRISYHNTTLRGLLRHAMAGHVDWAPSYQRDYVWTDADKERLLDSIFNKKDIGKFVTLNYKWPRTDIEILDGKQRLSTLSDFFLNKFKYRGYYYYELSCRDQYNLEEYMVQHADVPADKLTEADKLQMFLEVNAAGVPQTEEHITTIKARYEELTKE
jgi:hypothetical protein